MIGHTHEFFAEDDAEAIDFATVWAADAPMVLWGREGLVKNWGKPKDQ
jgi:hypothetical protein